MGLEEVVFVDLDAGTCRLGSQDGQDMDHALLPWAHHLQAAFQVCLTALHSLEGRHRLILVRVFSTHHKSSLPGRPA